MKYLKDMLITSLLMLTSIVGIVIVAVAIVLIGCFGLFYLILGFIVNLTDNQELHDVPKMDSSLSHN